jgi:hypothetical protein
MGKSKAVSVPTQSKSIANVDAELSKEVAALKDQIKQPGGKGIKLLPSGEFQSPEGLNLGNQIQFVPIDFISRNSFYVEAFDKDNPTPPTCYALGKNIKLMKPEDDSPDKQNATCAGCWANEFKSAANKKGKACRNFYDLAVKLVDPENPEAHNAPDAPLYTLSVSPKSLTAWDAIVPLIARALDGPPIKAVITASGHSQGTFATLQFHGDFVANQNYVQDLQRRAEASELLFRHPDFASYAAKAQAQAPARRGVRR